MERCRSYRPDDILLLMGPRDLPEITELVAALSELPTNVHINPTGIAELWTSAKVAKSRWRSDHSSFASAAFNI